METQKINNARNVIFAFNLTSYGLQLNIKGCPKVTGNKIGIKEQGNVGAALKI
jgi:hypothetical protein